MKPGLVALASHFFIKEFNFLLRLSSNPTHPFPLDSHFPVMVNFWKIFKEVFLLSTGGVLTGGFAPGKPEFYPGLNEVAAQHL